MTLLRMFFILLEVHATLGAFARLIPTLIWVHGAHIGKIVL